MGTMLSALLRLQAIERQVAHVRRRLKTRKNAVAAREQKIDQLRSDWDQLHAQSLEKRKQADQLELDLRVREQQVSKFRLALNTAKTNKEYAAILTQINTLKADNAALEEQALRLLQETDTVKADADKVQADIDAEEKRLEETNLTCGEDIRRLEAMLKELASKRTDAAGEVPADALAVFERIAENYDGEAMAMIEVHGKKPPHDYVCGGCFMSLSAEHTNALQSRDEIRRCDNCGRILYLEPQAEESTAK